MPGGDGTGPIGREPMTGWGRGWCRGGAGANRPRWGRAHRFGGGGRTRGWQWWRGDVSERHLLEAREAALGGELEEVRRRLGELRAEG